MVTTSIWDTDSLAWSVDKNEGQFRLAKNSEDLFTSKNCPKINKPK